MYSLFSIKPVETLTSKELRCLNLAIGKISESQFSASRRMGACLEKGQCLLCGPK